MENINVEVPTMLKIISWVIIVFSVFTLFPALGVVSMNGLNMKATLGIISIVLYFVSAIGLLKAKKWGFYLFLALTIYGFGNFLYKIFLGREGSELVMQVARSGLLLIPTVLILVYLFIIRKKFI